ncbi:MAG: ferrochelatase [Acidobacteria bacterium]|nr:ferrochelatase [Acidobacteriota bacterium]
MSKLVGVVLLNLGGPDSLEAVEPFLYNLFSDPDIIDFPLSFLVRTQLAKLIARKRHPGVQEQYKKIGGGSPIREHTQRQADMLEERLNAHLPAKVYVAMRYWKPSTEEAIDRIVADGIEKVVLLPLYPQYSLATTLSSVKEWDKQLAARGLSFDTTLVGSYYDFPPYIDSLVERVEQARARFPSGVRPHILFSAHGTPIKLVKKGDPYSDHIKKTVEAVLKRGNFGLDHSLCYQSKVGPMKWLTPSTPDTIKELAGRGVKHMLLVPVAFASDHLETLFELGIEYRHQAAAAGVEQYEITEGLNDSELFAEALTQLVIREIGRRNSERARAAAS